MSEVIIKDVFGVDISFRGETPVSLASIDCSMSVGDKPMRGKHQFVHAAYIAIIQHDDLVAKNKELYEALSLAHSWLLIDREYEGSPICTQIEKALSTAP